MTGSTIGTFQNVTLHNFLCDACCLPLAACHLLLVYATCCLLLVTLVTCFVLLLLATCFGVADDVDVNGASHSKDAERDRRKLKWTSHDGEFIPESVPPTRNQFAVRRYDEFPVDRSK